MLISIWIIFKYVIHMAFQTQALCTTHGKWLKIRQDRRWKWTWARKPPKAGPIINPLPHAVLTWNHVKDNIFWRFKLISEIWKYDKNLLMISPEHDVHHGKLRMHMPNFERVSVISRKVVNNLKDSICIFSQIILDKLFKGGIVEGINFNLPINKCKMLCTHHYNFLFFYFFCQIDGFELN